MMLCSLLVASFHIKKGKVGMDELIVRFQTLRLLTFSNCSGIVTFTIVSHSQCELGIKVIRLLLKNAVELCYRHIVLALAELEHGFIVDSLERVHFGKATYPGARSSATLGRAYMVGASLRARRFRRECANWSDGALE